jgi:hypothetical protein
MGNASNYLVINRIQEVPEFKGPLGSFLLSD